MTNPNRLSLVVTVLAAYCICSPAALFAQEDGKQPSGKKAFANPYDFSKPPVIKKFDAPEQDEIRKAINRGVAFLLKTQNKNGSWGSPTRTKNLNIYAPIPGAHDAFRTAVTSLTIAALLETDPKNPDVRAAVKRGETWLFENLPKLKRATGDAIYNVWGHAYSIQALVRLLREDGNSKERIAKLESLIKLQLEMLTRYESVDGGWGYYDFRAQGRKPTSSSISFVNATVLIAMHEGSTVGVEPPKRIVKRGIAAIKRQKKPDFTYLYGEYLDKQPMRGINRPGGSLGRTQACNLALRLWGEEDVTDNVLKVWLYRLYARNGWLDIGRKRPVPHESWMQVAGYFYYYGHFYGAMCIDQLSPSERSDYQGMLAKLMLDRQEKDGSWWDYPLYNYHQQYGTAFSLMTLVRCLDPTKEDTPK